MRRRRVVVGVFALFTMLAALYAVLRTEPYPYRTAIEVGTYANNELDGTVKGETRLRFLEDPGVVEQKIEQAYIPTARREVDRPDEPAPEIEVRTGGRDADAGMLVLYSETAPESAASVEAVQQRVVEQLQAAHGRILGPIEARQENRLEQASARLEFLHRDEVERSRIQPLETAVTDAERTLAELDTQYRSERLELQNSLAQQRREAGRLEDRGKQLQAEIERVGDRRALVETQLESQWTLVAELQDARVEATAGVDSSAESMAVLTIGAQLDRARTRADNLEETLQIGLPAQRDALQADRLDNRRTREGAADQIDALKANLADLQETYERDRAAAGQALAAARTALGRGRADYEKDVQDQQRAVRSARIALQELAPTQPLFVAERDLRPAGPGSIVIVVLGAILGGMLGVFGAFVAEFGAAARRRREAGKSAPAEESPAMELFPVDDASTAAQERSGTHG